jgi:tetraacyldisaccharide 4'-kinase
MLGPSEFRDLVSGRRRGIGPSAVRAILRAGEVPYTGFVARRNRRYDLGHSAIERVSVPVVSIGNLTLGGTGKTPLVKWLARWMEAQGYRSAIVSRGYGAAPDEQNDEALELAQALPNVPHIQNRDRVAGAQRAIDEFNSQCVLMDDGFQHRRLARDLDIVLLDALEPFGFEHVFPRGTLREPLAGLKRAHAVCLSRADAIAERERASIKRRVAEIAPHAIWCELAHTADCLIDSTGQTKSLASLKNQRVAAFCAIGNPAGFRHTLAGTNCEVVAWREFPDHHRFTCAELETVGTEASAKRAQLVVCTQKDLVKFQQDRLGGLPVWALSIQIQFLSGKEELEALLKQILPRP